MSDGLKNQFQVPMLTPTSSLTILRVPTFDGIEIKKASFLNKKFPSHFHQEWSLSLIKSGSEIIKTQQVEFQLNTDSLILIPPYLTHANSGHQEAGWQYASIYINQDAAKSICRDYQSMLPTGYDECFKVSYRPEFVMLFKELIKEDISNIIRESLIKKLFIDLLLENNQPFQEQSEKSNQSIFLNEIIEFLRMNSSRKITLTELSYQFKRDKYKLLRSFRNGIGLTPQEYLTALRIELSKRLLFIGMPLVEVALESGFYDQSHFTHKFNKYVGVSPLTYQKNCNILQDSI